MAKDRRSAERSFRTGLGGLALAPAMALALAAAPVAAQDDNAATDQMDEAGKLALQAANKMVRALELFIDDLPQYEPPEVLPNGDIILKRVNPPDGNGNSDSIEAPEDSGSGQREALVPEAPDSLPRSNRTPDGSGNGDGAEAEAERRI